MNLLLKKFDGIKNHKTILLLNKVLVVAILLASLINISIYTSPTASATTERTRIIADDSRELGEFEGLSPTPEPWEDSMRTDPTPNTFEL
jgi:hypothetical protein